MRIKSIVLPSSQRFPCTKREVKEQLADTIVDYVEFRHTMVNLPRYSHLEVEGHVLAIADTTRARDRASFYVFPIKKDDYSDAAAEEFSSTYLPKLREWFDEQVAKPESDEPGSEELFFLWEDESHSTQPFTVHDIF